MTEMGQILIIAIITVLLAAVMTGTAIGLKRRYGREEHYGKHNKIYIKNGVDIKKREIKENFGQDIEIVNRNNFRTVCAERMPGSRAVKGVRCDIRLINLKDGKVYRKIFRERLFVGRVWDPDPQKDQIIIEKPQVSKRHCMIWEEEKRFYIMDQGSLNHTFVNQNEVLQKTQLRSGDILTVGDCDFKVQIRVLK